MPSHIPFIDGDQSASNRVTAAWLNGINTFVYTSIPAASGSSLVGHSPPGTGGATLTVKQKLAQSVNVLDYVGADPTGVADSTVAFTSACATLSAGGIVNFRGWFRLNSGFVIPDGIILKGDSPSVGQIDSGAYTPATISSALILGTGATFTLANRNGVQDCLVITSMLAPSGTYALPFANATVATNAVAAFAGTAFTPFSGAQVCDHRLENLLVLGFQYVYNGTAGNNLNRPLFRRVYFDCTNGITVTNVADIGRGEDCHGWPFMTANQSFTTLALLLRTGTAYMTGASSTWFKWEDCFEYGYAIGHRTSITGGDVRQIACGADSPITAQSNVGFQFDGAEACALNIGCTATGQGDCGFKLNPDTQNGDNDVKIIGPLCHGSNSANGYIHVMKGTYTISDGFFSDNSTVGHIKLDAGVTGVVSNPTFANNAGAIPIFGDATSVAKCILAGAIYTGTSTQKQPLPTWTPGISFGGAAVGVTYSIQQGSYQLNGRMVTADFKLTLTSKGSSTGQAAITGLPYTVNNEAGENGGGTIVQYSSWSGLTGAPFIEANETFTTANLYQTGAGGQNSVLDTNIANNSVIYGRISYFI